MPTPQPLVSIILPVYRESERHLGSSIESILSQTYKNIELIIGLDDPENHKLLSVINKYKALDSRVLLKVNKKNIGITKNLNALISQCKGHYVARMDADDISHPRRIEKQINYLNNHPDVYIVGSNVEFIDMDDSKLKDYQTSQSNFLFKPCLILGRPLVHPTWMMRKNIFSVLDGYRDIKYAEDFDFIFRALSKNLKIGIIKENLLKYRINNLSISRTKIFEQSESFNWARAYYFQRILFGKELHGPISKLLVRILTQSKYLSLKAEIKSKSIKGPSSDILVIISLLADPLSILARVLSRIRA